MHIRDAAIVRLAAPALVTLLTEPLLLLVDAGVVARLGTPELAGLGVAGLVLQTAAGLCVFLAYDTTAAVARQAGAGDTRVAVRLGLDGIGLAAVVGGVLGVLGLLLADPLVALLTDDVVVADHAAGYLRVSALGVPALLVLLAATGVLRGLQDTRTPLRVALAAVAVNAALNIGLVHGPPGPRDGLGLVGSALGTVLTQYLAAAALILAITRRGTVSGWRPRRRALAARGRAGAALLVRTAALRGVLVATTVAVGAGSGDVDTDLAAHHLAMTLWGVTVYALDAVAIAAQALVGQALGAGDAAEVRALTRRLRTWGWASGVVTGLLLLALGPPLIALLTPDDAVRAALVPVLAVAAIAQPAAGLVFVLDGVLIGAGDGAYLASAALGVALLGVPTVLLTAAAGGGLVAVWVAHSVTFVGGRLATLLPRARAGRWMRLGPETARGAPGSP
ncbi:MATE family efflux transporter [Nocardioides sp.]|uniref:MATE family efflux transporter n=1 Tax=Nocardioides sp. TaxID=35761 RepID=UPI00351388D5